MAEPSQSKSAARDKQVDIGGLYRRLECSPDGLTTDEAASRIAKLDRGASVAERSYA